MFPLGGLEVICLGLETGWTLTVDLVATSSFRASIGGGSDFDFDMDLDLLSESGGVNSAKSSFESFSSLLASPSIDLEAWKQIVAVLIVLDIIVVAKEEVELTSETEGLVAVEEVGILKAETRIRTEVGAIGTRTVGVMLVQFLVSSSIAPENWESA